MAIYKTPGVYINEISTFPPSVAEVETAIPVFIGYTEKATKTTANDLILKPTEINSLKQYEQYYGGANIEEIAIAITTNSDGSFAVDSFTEPAISYLLYESMRLFFANGGGRCYIVSVGLHQATPAIGNAGDGGSDPTTMYGLLDGLNIVRSEDEPTLIVIPEAVKLINTDYQSLVQAALTQCNDLQDRFGVFDIFDGAITLDNSGWAANRALFGNNNLRYGAAYYPFVRTTLNFPVASNESNVMVTADLNPAAALSSFQSSNTALYNFVKARLKEHYLVLPASAAVVGVYATTDRNRGVWKAPANVSLANVIEPVVKIDNSVQDGMNVDATTGKSINALRAFMGKGTLVWGARTLAGNDNEWRYVSVRRFYNQVEESVKKSTYWAVFEPNDANTWVKIRGLIENYLTQKWREGALAGATAQDAFFVRCGLGVTMDFQDILEGRINVEIGMAVVRPAEFIILKFSHKVQTS
ncbi:phage tail sheath family protein [Halioxenophilus sp. WMMB6]|uniref:phage tail sheath family protein n=1 Tax=Halioxenophilus sp. WMMB6 TaxID=3073815 RepID=UPI00295EA4B9|nr:phage tail sheath C-terminal domain-containing protein [Halioxenophilus sp. WMMB6]